MKLLKSAVVLMLSLGLVACATEDEAPTPLAGTPEGVTPPSGKADFGDGEVGNCEYIHQASSDITVLSARLIGRFAPSTNTVPADLNVDLNQCVEIASEAYNGYDCQFYDVCEEKTLDCRGELERMTGLPFVTNATFDYVIYVESEGDGSNGGQPYQKYYAEHMNCHVLEITTASRSDALPYATGIGFYFDGHFAFKPVANLLPWGYETLKNGDSATLHRFGAVAVCWAGSMSSSANRVYEFKPFMRFEAESKCYMNWDSVDGNYRVSAQVKEFDRSAEVLW